MAAELDTIDEISKNFSEMAKYIIFSSTYLPHVYIHLFTISPTSFMTLSSFEA